MVEVSLLIVENGNLEVCVLCVLELKDKNLKLLLCLYILCENCLNLLF